MTQANYTLILALAVAVAVGGVYVFRPEKDGVLPAEEVQSRQAEQATGPGGWPPPTVNMAEPLAEGVRVTLKTSHGDIEMLLDGTRAPKTVGNFVQLAKDDFYDGTTFHRIVPGFVIQGGDPLSKDQSRRAEHGTGGPGYTFEDEINATSYGLDTVPLADVMSPAEAAQLPPEVLEMTVQEFYEAQGYVYRTDVESLPVKRGFVAMANSGPNTNGSQFFIVLLDDLPHLYGKHTVFGKVEVGMDVVDAIAGVEVDERSNPVVPVVIDDVEVSEGGLVPGLEEVE